VHETVEESRIAEIDAIKEYQAINPKFGYNICNGGQGIDFTNNPALYELMKEKVWNNPERIKKASEALKGKKLSDLAMTNCIIWRQSKEGRAVMSASWTDERKAKASEATKNQMTESAKQNLRIKLKGRKDPRTEQGKINCSIAREKYLNSDIGKQKVREGYKKMISNPENAQKIRIAQDKWRASEANQENCKRMAQKSREKCSKKVKMSDCDIIYNSQRELAKALNLNEATVSRMVKSGEIIRV